MLDWVILLKHPNTPFAFAAVSDSKKFMNLSSGRSGDRSRGAATSAEAQSRLEAEPDSGSRLIGRVLSPALWLWLRTQVEHSEDLQFEIISSDRRLLQGWVSQVNLLARTAVYRGLRLSQVQLAATHIRINLGQVVRGKSLRLLEPFLISGQVRLSASDIKASLQTVTMSEALQNFLVKICLSDRTSSLLSDKVKAIAQVPPTQLTGSGYLRGDVLTICLSDRQTQAHLILSTRLQIEQGRLLTLLQPQMLDNPAAIAGTPLTELHGLQVDLGADVEIQTLEFRDGQLLCQGSVKVNPAN
ncbi:MAG: DUF2993 domain-containing protein [Leptolyngbyaceae cyanobacterium SM1_1_3]|nr:DUF2993 domain-containing protein [Leptolyngbyaceae cyanobacterium SM1_1_3]NJN03761.1 DUF2993 domain-containing protein [Leptolyngbyaceae cyanobacterium RM1_1_2]NJO08520.1 DUF2993 domain-containing protein [Leptolyngbyaceae cyanobacterium SL_1_1]